MRGQIIICAAVEPEAKAIARELRLGRADAGSGVRRGSMSGRALELWTIGPRARRLPAAGKLAGASAVLVAGVAGGLDPALHRGDAIVQDWPGEIALPDALIPGKIHTADQVCATPGHKADLRSSTGGSVVDMEHRIVQRVCTAAGVPCVGIRAVLDCADEALDPALLTLVDSHGKLRFGRAGLFILRAPHRLPALMGLARASRQSTRALARAVRSCVEALAPALPAADSAGLHRSDLA